jgi:hypothetical protein
MAFYARAVGGLAIGVGLGSLLHDALQLDGSAAVILGILLYGAVLVTRRVLARTSLWDNSRKWYRRDGRGMIAWAVVEIASPARCKSEVA